MFELSVACKYLIPRWRQLSVSIISLVSTLVIALVVWLIVVFFSVKDGLEGGWIDKIIALTAPVRVTPTEKYYDSYYYLVDSISATSNYTHKTIKEKRLSTATDPYDPNVDEEAPIHWPKGIRDQQNSLVDLVKEVFSATQTISGLKNLKINDYETTMATLRLRTLRGGPNLSQQFLEHASYIGSLENDNRLIAKALLPYTGADLQNLIQMQSISSDNIQTDSADAIHRVSKDQLKSNLEHYFSAIHISTLKTPSQEWRLPLNLLPENGELAASGIMKENHLTKIIIPLNKKDNQALIDRLTKDGLVAVPLTLHISNGVIFTQMSNEASQPMNEFTTLYLDKELPLNAQLLSSSLEHASNAIGLHFYIDTMIQGIPLKGLLALGRLEIADGKIMESNNRLMARPVEDHQGLTLPKNPAVGEAILLPKTFREAGVLIGDQGYVSYYSPTPSTIQEQRLPVFVAGFYDPGIMPIGGKFILADQTLPALIRASYDNNETLISNGINIRFDNIQDAPRVKAELLQAFEKNGIAPYWHVETYQEYDYTKDLIQQLHSEKNLFSLISLVIIVVACSNIISMLIILVNDKKLEIGIMRSMGATSASIAMIFGICGMVMGAVGSLLGILAAILTLRNINELVGFISRIQGYDLFNPVFYGNTLPSTLSLEALSFVFMTTAVISLLAGIVPAIKASMLRPSAILRAE